MSRPSYTEAASLANRSDEIGTSLKEQWNGGPAMKGYGPLGSYQGTREFQRDHPRYPDYIYPDDKERDTYYEAKQALAQQMPTGIVMAGEKDVQYLLDKKNAQELILFKQFVEDSIPRGTPWAKDYFERFMPGWYQSKIDIIQDKLAMVNRFIGITVRGPQNIEDMMLLYQLYSGKFSLPQNWGELLKPVNQQTDNQYFASGLFNPKKRFTNEYYISKINQQYLANFAIPGIDLKGLHDSNPPGAASLPYAGNGQAGNDTAIGYAGGILVGQGNQNYSRRVFGDKTVAQLPNETTALNYRLKEQLVAGARPAAQIPNF